MYNGVFEQTSAAILIYNVDTLEPAIFGPNREVSAVEKFKVHYSRTSLLWTLWDQLFLSLIERFPQ